ncbi:hypothetical protein RHSIM_Rhsim04G0225800 [Rhododendron simsii]|uniref:Uncharacterized protein n=1 Tax=Rhododendron simsii TaxID=118357 RepID=A0A834H189_RHOSS|nr:hypothetical protein RHSIM_Rhsim04G0225800 [Rhododendron simsii]
MMDLDTATELDPTLPYPYKYRAVLLTEESNVDTAIQKSNRIIGYRGDHLVELLRHHVQQWSQADCWMQLYDLSSSVDDIGFLAIVHCILANDPGKASYASVSLSTYNAILVMKNKWLCDKHILSALLGP